MKRVSNWEVNEVSVKRIHRTWDHRKKHAPAKLVVQSGKKVKKVYNLIKFKTNSKRRKEAEMIYTKSSSAAAINAKRLMNKLSQ